jgi:hypothetical protein
LKLSRGLSRVNWLQYGWKVLVMSNKDTPSLRKLLGFRTSVLKELGTETKYVCMYVCMYVYIYIYIKSYYKIISLSLPSVAY